MPRLQITRCGITERQVRAIVRYDNLFDDVADFGALYAAYEDASKGRRYKQEIMEATARIELIVSDLVRELRTGSYKPGGYYEFETHSEVKRRIIHAPLFRDRIVQHALCNVLVPLYEKKFIYDSYANRKGKGNHKAVKRVQHFLQRTVKGAYVLQGDFQKYYDSVGHETLKEELRRTLKDERLLWLCDEIVDSYNSDIERGIPIGAPFSQLMANVHLNGFDHFIKDGLRVKHYVRLMDDFIIIGRKDELKGFLKEIQWYVETQLKQPLNRKTRIYPASHGIDFGGYRIFRNQILPRKRNIKAAKIRLKTIKWLYRHRLVDLPDARRQVAALIGYTSHCNSRETVAHILTDFVLQRGDD